MALGKAAALARQSKDPRDRQVLEMVERMRHENPWLDDFLGIDWGPAGNLLD